MRVEHSSVSDSKSGKSYVFQDILTCVVIEFDQQVLVQDEHFEPINGDMGYHLDGKDYLLKQGQSALLPAGKVHTFWPADPTQTVVYRVLSIMPHLQT